MDRTPFHNSLCVGIPVSEYDTINSTSFINRREHETIKQFFAGKKYKKILLFGGGTTGKKIQEVIGEYFAGFVSSKNLAKTKANDGDCVMITTAPIHVQIVEEQLKKSPLNKLPVIKLFDGQPINIRLILETQPRCGTDYTIRNLRKALGMGFATTFSIKDGDTTPDDLIMYNREDCRGYIVKTHFTRPLYYPQYRYQPTLYLLGYFPDTYYRWARLISGTVLKDEYYLNADSPEWQVVRAYIPLHLQWLDYIRDREYIRYEDYFSDFQGVMNTFECILGEYPTGFQKPRLIKSRIYHSGKYTPLMDGVVWDYLMNHFREFIKHYYSEKA